MYLVSPTVFNYCTAEQEWGRISTDTGKAKDKKPGGSLSERGGLDKTECKGETFLLTHM